MLSEAEQRRLAAIEVALRIDDPAFVRRFDRERLPSRPTMVTLFAFLTAMVVAVIALLSSSVVGAFIGLCGMCTVVGVWLARRAC
jgi:hypothetical protein